MAFTTVATINEVPDGEWIVVEMGEHWVAVFNVNGRLYAIEDICTHDGGPLAEGDLHGLTIECPRHGATFSLETASQPSRQRSRSRATRSAWRGTMYRWM